MSLRDACQRQHDSWLDYRPLRAGKIASGATYDDTVAGVRDGRAPRIPTAPSPE